MSRHAEVFLNYSHAFFGFLLGIRSGDLAWHWRLDCADQFHPTLAMSSDIDLSPVEFLHQVVHSVHFDKPFVALAQLQRTADDQVEWTVAVALPAEPAQDCPEHWWGVTLQETAVRDLFTVRPISAPPSLSRDLVPNRLD